MIHKTAIVSDKAIIAPNVEIGPFCVIGDNVELAAGVKLCSHVCIDGRTYVGEETQIYPFASIGHIPQDLKYDGENSEVIIGKNNTIREYVTIHPGTKQGNMKTTIGNNCLFMVNSHIAHDCIVGNNVILANNATLGGHVTVGDYAILGGLSAVHQFVRIGAHAIVGGVSAIVEDLIPYGSAAGKRANLLGINITGMKRRNFARAEIHAVRHAFKEIFGQAQHYESFAKRVELVMSKYGHIQSVAEIISFLRDNSVRSICLPPWLDKDERENEEND